MLTTADGNRVRPAPHDAPVSDWKATLKKPLGASAPLFVFLRLSGCVSRETDAKVKDAALADTPVVLLILFFSVPRIRVRVCLPLHALVSFLIPVLGFSLSCSAC